MKPDPRNTTPEGADRWASVPSASYPRGALVRLADHDGPDTATVISSEPCPNCGQPGYHVQRTPGSFTRWASSHGWWHAASIVLVGTDNAPSGQAPAALLQAETDPAGVVHARAVAGVRCAEMLRALLDPDMAGVLEIRRRAAQALAEWDGSTADTMAACRAEVVER